MDRLYDLKVLIVGLVVGMVAVMETLPADAVVNHGDQIAVVANTPAGRVRARSVPTESADGRFVKGAFIEWIPEGVTMKLVERGSFGNEGDWVQVELPSGESGWITARYLKADIARDKLIVLPTNVNIRNQASVGSRSIDKATKGTALGMVRERNGWYLVLLPSGRRGWIRADMVRHEPLNPAAAPPAEPAKASRTETPPPAPEPEPPAPEIDYAARAKELTGAGNHAEAADAFRKAVEEEPTNGALLFDAAKTFEKVGEREDAIDHYRRAIKGRPSRPEAQFYLDRLLKPAEEEDIAEPAPVAEEEDEPSFEFVSAYAGFLLPALAIGALAFVAVLLIVYRRRRSSGPTHPMYRRRQPDGGFDDVLKYAVEKRPVIREIEEAEKKLAEMDDALRKRVDAFGASGDDGRPALPPGESAEVLLGKIEALRKTVLNQEERSRIYADLVYLQNEKMGALDEEIDALKKLIKLDYPGGKKALDSKPKTPAKSAAKEA